MQRTKVATLLLVAAATTILGWGAIRVFEGRGSYVPAVPWMVDVAILALAGAVLWAGLAVRAYQAGRRPSLNAIRAARTLVLAKASALTGAVLTGWYLAQVLAVVGELAVEARRDKAVAAAVAVGCAIVLAVVGVLVERFCQLPPLGNGENGEGGGAVRGEPDASGASTSA